MATKRKDKDERPQTRAAIHTTLAALPAAAFELLRSEGPGGSDTKDNAILEELIRAAVERMRPGAWARAAALDAQLAGEGVAFGDRVERIVSALRGES